MRGVTRMEKKTNGLAVAGFVVSIASPLIDFWGLVGGVGLELSAIGKSQINRDGTDGNKLATAGIIIGIIGVIDGLVSYAALLS